MKKKGQYMIIDVFIAFSVLSIGALLLIDRVQVDPPTESLELVSEEIAGRILDLKVRELNDPVIRDHIKKGYITNVDNSILQQAYELKFLANNNNAADLFINASIEKLVRPQFNVEVLVDGRTVYLKMINPNRVSDRAGNLVSRKKIVSGFYNNSVLWGPYRAEVRVWE